MKPSDRSELFKAIGEHIAQHGANDWGPLQARFPSVPIRTFWRAVKAVREQPPQVAQIEAARDRVRHIPSALPSRSDERVPLPAPVPLGYLTQSGPEGLRKIDLLQNIHGAMADIDLLRRHSITPDGTQVQDAKVLADSVRLRLTLSELFLSVINEVYSRDRQQQFYDQIIETIRQESPECAMRIVRRLKSLNALPV